MENGAKYVYIIRGLGEIFSRKKEVEIMVNSMETTAKTFFSPFLSH